MFNVPPNTLGHIGDGFLRDKWPNQQCQSTEGRHWTKLNQIQQNTKKRERSVYEKMDRTFCVSVPQF